MLRKGREVFGPTFENLRLKCKVGRNSVEVKVLLFQLDAWVSNCLLNCMRTELLTRAPNRNNKILTSIESLMTLNFMCTEVLTRAPNWNKKTLTSIESQTTLHFMRTKLLTRASNWFRNNKILTSTWVSNDFTLHVYGITD